MVPTAQYASPVAGAGSQARVIGLGRSGARLVHNASTAPERATSGVLNMIGTNRTIMRTRPLHIVAQCYTSGFGEFRGGESVAPS